MIKHTPGPWSVDCRVGCIAVYPAGESHNCLDLAKEWAIHFKGGRQVVDDNGIFCRWTMDDEAIANAHLISAAPDLLHELEMTHAALMISKIGHYVDSPQCERTKAAIKKAKGGDPQ